MFKFLKSSKFINFVLDVAIMALSLITELVVSKRGQTL